MESRVVPAPREYTHTIIPHGHTRRVPVEAVCRLAEVPGALLCPCQDTAPSSDSGTAGLERTVVSGKRVRIKSVGSEASADHHPHIVGGGEEELASHSTETLLVQESVVEDDQGVLPVEEALFQGSVTESGGDLSEAPIPVDYFCSCNQSVHETSQAVTPEEPPNEPAVTRALEENAAEPTGSWLKCCTSNCCESSLQPEPEASSPPQLMEKQEPSLVQSPTQPTEQPEPLLVQKPTASQRPEEDRATWWITNCCGSSAQPEAESTLSSTAKPGSRPAAADVATAPEKKIVDAVLPEVASKPRAVPRKDEEKHKSGQIIYIDHCPEPFVKEYFGDDGSVEVPDDYRAGERGAAALPRNIRNWAFGSAIGVVVTAGAVVVGAAALTAGLAIGITAKEVYKRLTNNYDI